MAARIFGIDLGTTNSCLAVMAPGGPRAIPIDGDPIVPSVVSFDGAAGGFVVGRRARHRLVLEPESTVRSIKRRMGRTERVRLGGRELLPEEVSAEILRYLKREGGRACGEAVERAVITVPAYFGDAQRRATIRAGELAGLEVVRILNEPTAAALVYDRLVARRVSPQAAAGGAAEAGPGGAARAPAAVQRILVYDLGGGTFDVSVVEIGGEIDEVRASCGDTELGGDDFDRLLADHLAERFAAQVGRALHRELRDDLRLAARLDDAAERAKIELSSRPHARVVEEALLGRHHLDLEVGRDRFEELVEELLAGTMDEVERALTEARLAADELDRVILVGGSTHIPRVHELLEERFSCPVEHALDPALCVAMGAAVQGALLGGELFDQILVDVAAHSLGVKTGDNLLSLESLATGEEADHFSVIIPRNSRVPTTRAELYHTMIDRQKEVRVEVYQGESGRCSENTEIGAFVFPLEPAPMNSPVVVELGYDLEGIIRVVVQQKGTANRREVTLSSRRRQPEEGSEPAAGAVENYILRKARARAAALPAGELRQGLAAAADAYQAALADAAADPDAVDRAEEALLDLLDQAEEAVVAEGV